MKDFNYMNQTEIVFGRHKEERIGEYLQKAGAHKVLLCYGKNSVIRMGLLKKVIDSIVAANIQYIEFGGVSANPRKDHMLAGVKLAKESKIDYIIALGGGSVIDEAKAIAIGALNPDFWDLYQKGTGSETSEALPIAAILTIPAAGSESSTASVIRDQDSGIKYAVHSELIRPRLAFINPENCFTLPPEQIANGISDILAHLLERYFTPQNHVTFTDCLLEGAMRALINIAPKVYQNHENYDYWSELCLIGTLAHNGMLDMGRPEQDWGVHSIENKVLSGVYNLAHGAGLAILFPAWMRLVGNKRPERVAQFFRQVFDVKALSDQGVIDQGLLRLKSFYLSLGLAINLQSVGIKASEIKKIIPNVYQKDRQVGAYGKISIEEIYQIIDLAQ